MNVGSSKRNGLEVPALKKRFLQCFGERNANSAAMQETVRRLADLGVSRKALVGLGVRAGWSKASVSSVLSRIFCALGLRERRPGAGRKVSRDALEHLAYTRSKYGANARKVLRGALRAESAQPNSGTGQCPPQDGESANLISVHQLQATNTNFGTAINRNGNAMRWNGFNSHPSSGNVSKRNGTGKSKGKFAP
jgi:hypothetical protein